MHQEVDCVPIYAIELRILFVTFVCGNYCNQILMRGNVLLESWPAYWISQLCFRFCALFDSCSTYVVLLPPDVIHYTGLSYGILFSVAESLCLACPVRSGLDFPKGYITNICAHKTVEGLYFLIKANTRVLQIFLTNTHFMFGRDNSLQSCEMC